jgi:NADH-quinone oxidoreductase subunit A
MLGAMTGQQPYLVIAAVIAAGILLFAAATGVARLMRPQVRSAEKSLTYESGVDPVGRGWAQINIRYFLYVFLYLIFAVDAVYLFPWATVLVKFGWATLAEMGVFIMILTIGLLHAIRRKALKWS